MNNTYTTKEFCEMIQISTRKLSDLIKDKKINPLKKGNKYIFNDTNIQEYNNLIDIKLLEGEEFVEIKDHPNYLISNYGRIYLKIKRRLAKGQIDKDGYLLVTIDAKQYRVHRLVGFHFLEKTDCMETINHKDCNKLNNHVSNLEWMSFAENTKQAIIDGLHKDSLYNKISKEKVIEICEYLTNCNPNESLISISKKFNISRTTITSIYNKTRFKDITKNYKFVILNSVKQKHK